MLRKTFALCLSLCLLLCAAALAESPTEYTLPYDGVVFSLSFLPGGDILLHGSFGRQAEDGRYAETIARARPDGAVVWALDLPFPIDEQSIPTCLLALSGGRYVVTHAMGEGDLRAFFLDMEQGVTGETQLPFGDQQYIAVDEGILEAQRNADGIRLRWLDLAFEEVQTKNYALENPLERYTMLRVTDDALYLVSQAYSGRPKGTGNLILNLTHNGLLRWQNAYASPYPGMDIVRPDGEGGLLLLGGNGMYDDTVHYPYTARRIDADGNTVWEKEIEVGEWNIRLDTQTAGGIRMVWETDDVFRFVTLTRDGEWIQEPVREKPHAGLADVHCMVSGYLPDEAGREWVYYLTVRDIDPYNTDVVSYLQPLEAFPVQEASADS